MMSIQAGYQLHILSYEGDADNHQTEIISGLTSEDVRYLLEVLGNFGISGDFGNDRIEDDELFHEFKIAMANHPLTSKECEKFRPSNIDEARDVIHELLGSSEIDYMFVRYFNKHKVYFVPHEIIDVSDQFK